MQQKGAEDAFSQMLTDGYSRLVGAVLIIVRNRATAEDIVQETYARAFINWSKLWPDGNPAAWTYRVATNLATSWWRTAARETRALARVAMQRTPDAMQESDVEFSEMLALLPPRQRAAVALHYNLGLSMNEVALAMRCRPGTVKSLLHSAREKLRVEMKHDE